MQILLREIGSVYDEFEAISITGIYDEPTERAIKELQRASMLEVTGKLDKNTYRRLLNDLSSHSSF